MPQPSTGGQKLLEIPHLSSVTNAFAFKHLTRHFHTLVKRDDDGVEPALEIRPAFLHKQVARSRGAVDSGIRDDEVALTTSLVICVRCPMNLHLGHEIEEFRGNKMLQYRALVMIPGQEDNK